MKQHPEQRRGEVFVSNMDEESPWPWLWTSHFLIGQVAYDLHGKMLSWMRPVFAYRSKLTPDVLARIDARNETRRYWPH